MRLLFIALIAMSFPLLFSQVSFELDFVIDYSILSSSLDNVQLIDINSDDQEDIVLFFHTFGGDLIIQCYETTGDFICDRIINGYEYFDSWGHITSLNGETIIVSQFCTEGMYPDDPELIIKVSDFNNNTLLDSLSISIDDDPFLNPIQSAELKVLQIQNELVILAGVLNDNFCHMHTDLYRFTYNGEITYNQVFENCGDEVITVEDSDNIFCIGYEQISDDEGYGDSVNRYLFLLSSYNLLDIYPFYVSSGWSNSNGAYSNYPRQLTMITQNDLSYSDYGLMLQEKIQVTDGHFVTFKNYPPDSSNLLWSNDLTQIGTDFIISSTCVNVNDAENYVMYFRNSFLEIRDRISGEIIHHQNSDISPKHIKRNSSNELLFLDDDSEEDVVSIHKLSEEIYVSTNDNNIPDVDFNLKNIPNPFNPVTIFSFVVPDLSVVDLVIYNSKGQRIKTVLSDEIIKGKYSVIWDGTDEEHVEMPSGLYYYSLVIDKGQKVTKKCVLLK